MKQSEKIKKVNRWLRSLAKIHGEMSRVPDDGTPVDNHITASLYCLWDLKKQLKLAVYSYEAEQKEGGQI